MKVLPIICLAIASFGFISNGVFAKEFKTNDGFSITLPEGWVQIPKEALEDYSDTIFKASPGIGRQSYEYGFQLSQDPTWLTTYPYMLVQVKHSGRVPEAKLKELSKVEKGLGEGASKVQSSMKDLLSNMEIGKPIYDDVHQTLFSQMSMDVVGAGKVNGLISVVLTEKGAINIYGYSLASEFDRYSDIYGNAVRNILLDDSLKYTPRITDNVPFISRIDWQQVFIAAIVGGVLAGVFSLFRRKKDS